MNAYIKIEFDLKDEEDKILKYDFNAFFYRYRFLRDNLNEQLLDFSLNKRLFTCRQRIELVNLNDYLDEYRNICDITPIHISYDDLSNIIKKEGCETPTKFYLWLRVDSYVIGTQDFDELKEWIGNRLDGLFSEIYGQLVDGWGEGLYFKLDNEQTNQEDIFSPEFKKETMELVEELEL